jgi:hypothetical protein
MQQVINHAFLKLGSKGIGINEKCKKQVEKSRFYCLFYTFMPI